MEIYKMLNITNEKYQGWLTKYLIYIKRNSYIKNLRLTQSNQLPIDFGLWNLDDDFGWTIAHEAARHGYLPDGFNQWDLATISGWTVAHEAASRDRKIPNNEFRDLKDIHGWTVAYIASL